MISVQTPPWRHVTDRVPWVSVSPQTVVGCLWLSFGSSVMRAAGPIVMRDATSCWWCIYEIAINWLHLYMAQGTTQNCFGHDSEQQWILPAIANVCRIANLQCRMLCRIVCWVVSGMQNCSGALHTLHWCHKSLRIGNYYMIDSYWDGKARQQICKKTFHS